MTAILQLLKATDGPRTYYFLGKAASYSSVGIELGISVPSEQEHDMPPTKVQALLTKGALMRINVGYKVNGKHRIAKLLCVRSKIGTALDALQGSAVNGHLITSANFPVKASFY